VITKTASKKKAGAGKNHLSTSGGWAINEVASLNRYKSELALEYNDLDTEMESRSLFIVQRTRMELVACELDKIWPLEEIKSRQRSRDRNILEEDRNMVYFQAVANHKSRKKRVDALEDPNGLAKYHKRVMDIELL
jgi:hypothetical protein